MIGSRELTTVDIPIAQSSTSSGVSGEPAFTMISSQAGKGCTRTDCTACAIYCEHRYAGITTLIISEALPEDEPGRKSEGDGARLPPFELPFFGSIVPAH